MKLLHLFITVSSWSSCLVSDNHKIRRTIRFETIRAFSSWSHPVTMCPAGAASENPMDGIPCRKCLALVASHSCTENCPTSPRTDFNFNIAGLNKCNASDYNLHHLAFSIGWIQFTSFTTGTRYHSPLTSFTTGSQVKHRQRTPTFCRTSMDLGVQLGHPMSGSTTLRPGGGC